MLKRLEEAQVDVQEIRCLGLLSDPALGLVCCLLRLSPIFRSILIGIFALSLSGCFDFLFDEGTDRTSRAQAAAGGSIPVPTRVEWGAEGSDPCTVLRISVQVHSNRGLT